MQGIPQGQSSQGGSQKPSLSWQSANDKSKHLPMPPKVSQEKSSMGMYVGIFIGGLFIGGLLGAVFTGQRAPSGANAIATSTGQVADTSGALTGGSSIVVASPQKSGRSVVVSNVQVTKPTWVVVYDNNAGVPGHALGASLFFPAAVGGKTSGTIELFRPIVSGTTYLVGQQLDSNGDKIYSHSTDPMVQDAGGQPVLVTLTAN